MGSISPYQSGSAGQGRGNLVGRQACGGLFSGFITYRNAFSAASTALQGDTSKDTKVQVLDRVDNAARGCMEDARQARLQFEHWVSGSLTHLDAVNESIKDAWANLGSAEKQVVELSQRIIAVQDGLNALTGVVAPDRLHLKPSPT